MLISDSKPYQVDVVDKIKDSRVFKKWPDCCSVLLEYEAFLCGITNLVTSSCLAAGGDPKAGVPIAAACSSLNVAAHLIDRTQDSLAHSIPGIDNLSLALIFAAYNFLSDVHPSYLNQVLCVFSDSSFHAVLGQNKGFTLTKETSPVEALEHYWSATVLKSGNLFRLATAGSAAAVTHDENVITALGEYGTALGTIHQILDDCRDVLDEQGSYEISLPVLLYSLSLESQTVVFPPVQSRTELQRTLEETKTFQTISGVLLNWQQRGLESLAVLDTSEATEQLKTTLTSILHEDFVQVNV